MKRVIDLTLSGRVGGFGGKARPKHKRNRMVRIDAQSIIEGWDVPPKERAKTVDRLVKLRDEAKGDRDALRACEALMRVPGMQISAAQLKIAQDQAPGSEATKSLIEEMEARDDALDRERSDGASPQEVPQ